MPSSKMFRTLQGLCFLSAFYGYISFCADFVCICDCLRRKCAKTLTCINFYRNFATFMLLRTNEAANV